MAVRVALTKCWSVNLLSGLMLWQGHNTCQLWLSLKSHYRTGRSHTFHTVIDGHFYWWDSSAAESPPCCSDSQHARSPWESSVVLQSSRKHPQWEGLTHETWDRAFQLIASACLHCDKEQRHSNFHSALCFEVINLEAFVVFFNFMGPDGTT